MIAPYATDVSTHGSELDALNEKMNTLSQVVVVVVVVVAVVVILMILIMLNIFFAIQRR